MNPTSLPLSPDASPEQQLMELCAISSSTANITGVAEAQKYVGRQLKAMGFEVDWLNLNPMTGPLLSARYKGSLDWQVSFVGHADTCVEPSTALHKINDRLIGPGVADDKGGLIVALSGLRRFLRKPGPKPHLHFVSSPNEEAGSTGHHSFFAEVGTQSSIVLGFEPALEDGSIISSRFGNRWYKINIKGKSTHAGRVGAAHQNAAHELAHKIVELHRLHQPEEGLKVNIGAITAGQDRYNITCGEASAKLDTRFESFEGRDLLHQNIIEILSENHCGVGDEKCETQFLIEDDCPPLSPRSQSHPHIESYLKQIQNIEAKPIQAKVSGGAADVNYFTTRTNVVFDGLGPIGAALHTQRESILISSLESRAEALFGYLSSLQS